MVPSFRYLLIFDAVSLPVSTHSFQLFRSPPFLQPAHQVPHPDHTLHHATPTKELLIDTLYGALAKLISLQTTADFLPIQGDDHTNNLAALLLNSPNGLANGRPRGDDVIQDNDFGTFEWRADDPSSFAVVLCLFAVVGVRHIVIEITREAQRGRRCERYALVRWAEKNAVGRLREGVVEECRVRRT